MGPIRLQSTHLTVIIEPELGGRIASIQDDAGHEFVAVSPWPRPPAIPAAAPYLAGGLGGIDDCLPAIAPGAYPASPYRDWRVPDHGELWQRPWEIARETQTELDLEIAGAVLPYALRRRASVAGRELRIEYALHNRGRHPLPCVWSAHALLAATAGMQIDAGTLQEVWLDATCSDGLQAYQRLPYPSFMLGDRAIDLREWDSVPAGFYAKFFCPSQSGSQSLGPTAHVRGALHHPTWQSSIEVVAEAAQPLWLGVWVNRDGIPADAPVQHVALEPTFGTCDALDRALEDGSCLVLSPGAEERWTVTYRVSPWRQR